MSGAGSAMALEGMQGTCFDDMRSSSSFSRINVPALLCAGATGAVSGLVLRKGNAYRIPVYPETHRKRNTPVSASGRQRLDRLGSDNPATRDAEQASRVGSVRLTKNIEDWKSLC